MTKELAKNQFVPKKLYNKSKYTPARLKEIVQEFNDYIENQDEEFLPDVVEFCALMKIPRSSLYKIKDNPESYGKYSQEISDCIEQCNAVHEAKLYKLALAGKVNSNVALMKLNRLGNISERKQSLNMQNIQINISKMSDEEKMNILLEEVDVE